MSGPLVSLRADMVHPSHFAALFPTLGPAAISRLRHCARLSMRLAGQISDLGAIPSKSEATGPERMALLSPERIEEAGNLMGAAWHGRTLQACIDPDCVSELDARLGRAVRRFGLRQAALTAADGAPSSPGELADAILTDGRACLAAWREQLSGSCQRLADLKLPARGLPAAAPADKAWPIIEQVLREVADAP